MSSVTHQFARRAIRATATKLRSSACARLAQSWAMSACRQNATGTKARFFITADSATRATASAIVMVVLLRTSATRRMRVRLSTCAPGTVTITSAKTCAPVMHVANVWHKTPARSVDCAPGRQTRACRSVAVTYAAAAWISTPVNLRTALGTEHNRYASRHATPLQAQNQPLLAQSRHEG